MNKITNKKFFFFHSTTEDNIIKILTNGFIRPSIETGITRYSGENKSKYIYANIYFDDLHFVKSMNCGIIINPNVMLNQTIIFNDRWLGFKSSNSIVVTKSSNYETKTKNFKKIYNKMKNPSLSLPLPMLSEVLFKKPIAVEYIMGIFVKKPTRKLLNILKKFPEIKIISTNKFNLD